MNNEKQLKLEKLEIRLFLEAIYEYYGYDFRHYSSTYLGRRIRKSIEDEKVDTISTLQSLILHDTSSMFRFLENLSVNVTEMFRDPEIFRILRTVVFPELTNLGHIKIWHAGCASGEEVYSTAILLLEENLLDKTRIYATDISETLIEKGKSGIFPLKSMKAYTANYMASGGQCSFSKYYMAKYDHAIFKTNLKQNILWAIHNLASDRSFNEFQLVFCRNVMIYFDTFLQESVHKLIYESLCVGGFLILGSKESISFSPYENCYEELDAKVKIYRKIK